MFSLPFVIDFTNDRLFLIPKKKGKEERKFYLPIMQVNNKLVAAVELEQKWPAAILIYI